MPTVQSKAEAVWEGNLFEGKGTVTPESGAFGTLPVTWASRTQRAQGKTSPEELIAAAHASCYAMAFSNTLAKQGKNPTRLSITAAVTFEPGVGVTASELTVVGQVPGLGQEEFARIAAEGEKGCPVSNALRNNVKITVKATLES
jgi:osmotically inducible protein OsmC